MNPRRLLPLLLVASLAVGLALISGRAAPGATAPQRWIVFSAHPGGGSAPPQLLRVRANGSGLRQITRGQRPATEPAFSPDGKSIVFVRLGSGIFRMGLDGSGLKRLTAGARDIYPVWSPDGTRIAFLRPYKTNWRVHVLPAAGGRARLLPLAPPAGRPSWVANGKELLIPSGGDLVRIDAQSGKVRVYSGLELDIQTVQNATVSPNSRLLAYVGQRLSTGPPDCGEGRCPQYALYLAGVAAPHRPRKLLNDTGPAGWSADAKSLAFVNRGSLVVWTVANGARKAISVGAHIATGDSPPAWQPR